MVNFLPTTIGAGLELVSPSCPANYSSYCSTWEIGLSDGMSLFIFYILFNCLFIYEQINRNMARRSSKSSEQCRHITLPRFSCELYSGCERLRCSLPVSFSSLSFSSSLVPSLSPDLCHAKKPKKKMRRET